MTAYSPSVAAYQPESFTKMWLWFAWLVGVGITLVVGIALSHPWIVSMGLELPLYVFIFAPIPLISGIVIGYILLYRYWYVVQDGSARTSPGKAVGFTFIPLFNLYWSYVITVGLAQEMNRYCEERTVAGPRINEKLALSYFVLLVLTSIPVVQAATVIPVTVLGIKLYKQFSITAARIVETKMHAPAGE